MILLKTTFQYRNDFAGILECENCGHQQELNSGYDDHFYHTQVIPSIQCDKCNLNSKSVALTKSTESKKDVNHE